MTITKAEFLRGVRKGWENMGYCRLTCFAKDGLPQIRRDGATECCAIGAYSIATGAEPREIEMSFLRSGGDLVEVMLKSDRAGSKEAALEAIEKMEEW